MNNHKKISFRPQEAVPGAKSGQYNKMMYNLRHKKYKPVENEKTVKHPPADHTNPSREDHIERIMSISL